MNSSDEEDNVVVAQPAVTAAQAEKQDTVTAIADIADGELTSDATKGTKRAFEMALGLGSSATCALSAVVRPGAFQAGGLAAEVSDLGAVSQPVINAAILMGNQMLMEMLAQQARVLNELQQRSSVLAPAGSAAVLLAPVKEDITTIVKEARNILSKNPSDPLVVNKPVALFSAHLLSGLSVTSLLATSLNSPTGTIIAGRANRTVVNWRTLCVMVQSDRKDLLSSQSRKTVSALASIRIFSPSDVLFLKDYYQLKPVIKLRNVMRIALGATLEVRWKSVLVYSLVWADLVYPVARDEAVKTMGVFPASLEELKALSTDVVIQWLEAIGWTTEFIASFIFCMMSVLGVFSGQTDCRIPFSSKMHQIALVNIKKQLLTLSLEATVVADAEAGADDVYIINLPFASNVERNVALQAALDETTAQMESMKDTSGFAMMKERSTFRQARESVIA